MTKTCEFEADLTPREPDLRPGSHGWPRVRFNFDNGWSASLVVRTRWPGSSCRAMQAALAAAPTGEWGDGKTELGSQEATANEAIAWLAEIGDRDEPGIGFDPVAVIAALRHGLLDMADVEKAYELARAFAEGINTALNAAADSKDVDMATSLLARAIAARAVLIVAGDWWASSGSPITPPSCYHKALRSFLDRAPPGFVDGSEIAAEPEAV